MTARISNVEKLIFVITGVFFTLCAISIYCWERRWYAETFLSYSEFMEINTPTGFYGMLTLFGSLALLVFLIIVAISAMVQMRIEDRRRIRALLVGAVVAMIPIFAAPMLDAYYEHGISFGLIIACLVALISDAICIRRLVKSKKVFNGQN